MGVTVNLSKEIDVFSFAMRSARFKKNGIPIAIGKGGYCNPSELRSIFL